MYRIIFYCVFAVLFTQLHAQDPLRFQQEIEAFKIADDTTDYDDVILFTGSSSVRFWRSLEEDFPNVNVLNRGFGGSHFSDLIYFSDQLILQYLPKKIFIYEGDNDIAAGKSVDSIFMDAEYLIKKIRRTLPDAEIHFIAPKPSVARWELKDLYLTLIDKFRVWSAKDPKLYFVDVWTPMCDENGNVFTDIFITDNLHMNAKGYDIWEKVVRPYLDE